MTLLQNRCYAKFSLHNIMSRLEFEGHFDPNIVGPIQTRFTACPETGKLIPAQPIPNVNFELASSGIFPGQKPEDLPLPQIDVARRILQITAELGNLGCRIIDGGFDNRAENHGQIGQRVHTIMKELIETVNQDQEETAPQNEFLDALKKTHLFKTIRIKEPQAGRPIV